MYIKTIETWNGREWVKISGALPIGMYVIRVKEYHVTKPDGETRQPNILRIIRGDGGNS